MSLNQPLLLSSALVHQMLLNSDLSIQTSDLGTCHRLSIPSSE